MDTNKKNEASSSSLDDIEKKIHANQVLYDQLHQSLVDESLAQADEDEKSLANSKSEIGTEETVFSKLSNYYQSNELFRYAIWGLGAVFFATTILTIIEYPLFSGSVKDDVGDGFMFGGSEPNWIDTFFHTFWWAVVTFTTVGYGDVYPVTSMGKFFGAIIIILGIGTVALPSGILASAFTEHTKRNQKKYEDQLKLMLSDNVIDEEERKELEELSQRLNLSDEDILAIEEHYRNKK